MLADAALDALDTFADEADYALVGPRDSRVHEVATTRFPFNTVCHLCRDFGDGRCQGCTGTLIAPDRVLTAAHCLWSPARGGPPRTIRVRPGRRDRDTFPYGSIAATRWFLPRGFLRRRGSARKPFDYGVIELSRPFARPTRFMPVRALDERELSRLTASGLVTVAGYPGDRPVGTMWRHSERLKRFTSQMLYYSVDTCPGHSGSPVWTKIGDERVIIGVHTSGIVDEVGRSYGCRPGTVLAPAGMLNSGVRITRAVLDAIRNPVAPRRGDRAMVALP
jgi:V8-like Glu-specific endopeptidase